MKSPRSLLALACAGILALSLAQAAGDKAASGASCPLDKPAKACCADKAACCKDKKAECADKAGCCKDRKADAPKG